VQSEWRLATGWTAEGSEFEFRYRLDFSSLHVVQTGSVAHPTSYPMGNKVLSPGVKRPEREGD
jgi:hypothetical protein